MDAAHLAAVAAVTKAVGPIVKEHVEPLRAQIVALEQQIAEHQIEIAELKARPLGLKYCGTFERGTTYAADDGVTHRGSLGRTTDDHERPR